MPSIVQPQNQPDRNDVGREHYNRGFIEQLNPSDVLSDAQYSRLEEVPVAIEEPWTNEIEATLHSWVVQAKESGEAHKKSAFRMKARYRLFMLIILLWSSIILVVNDSVPCDAGSELRLVRLIINSLGVFLNGLFSTLNMGYTYRLHFEYETKFFELEQDIDYMLMRGREFRPAADVVMMEIREKRKQLADSPELVGKKFFGC